MAPGVGGDTDGERAELPGEFDELDRLAEIAGPDGRAGGWIAPQGQKVGDAVAPVALEDRGQLGPGVSYAREVGHRRHRRPAEDVDDEVVRTVAGRAPGAVGDRHERRPQRLQLRQRGGELGLGGVVAGWEELERVGRAGRQQRGDRRGAVRGRRHRSTLGNQR